MPRGVYDRKKKTAPAKSSKASKSAPVPHAGSPSDIPNVLRMDELTVLKLSKLEAEVRANRTEIQLKTQYLESLFKQVDPQGVLRKLQNEIVFLKNEMNQKSTEYADLKKVVGERFGINMEEYAYDDRTGILHHIQQPGAEGQEQSQQTAQEVLPTQNPPSVQ
jgi:hypothetical protein